MKMNEQEMRERIDRRLSFLQADEARRAHIRTAIHAERRDTKTMKRKIPVLALALIAVMLMGSIALAEHLNLFDFFGENDQRYALLAPQAALTVTDSAMLEHPYLGNVKAGMDSAYFDGLTLSLAYRIENSRYAEEYIPTEEEIALMQLDEPVLLGLVGDEPGYEIYQAYNDAVQNGTPFGYRQYHIYPSDHTVTDDGIDIPPYSMREEYDENGDYCAMREFDVPLPQDLQNRESLHVSIDMHLQETIVWFDGENCYLKFERSEIGKMTASIPSTEGNLVKFHGEGKLNGVKYIAEAVVSPMAASVNFKSDTPLNEFLQAPPTGMDPRDVWVETLLTDENGRKYRATEGYSLDERTGITVSFTGVGELPEKLYLRVFSTWVGENAPDGKNAPEMELHIKK